MTKTFSTMLPLGTEAPHFYLNDTVTGNRFDFKNTTNCMAMVIMFICNHCPFVKHVALELTKLANDYQSKDICFIAINANDSEAYPDDSPENMKKMAAEYQFPFPYLFDETQEVAKAYQAACTPDFFIFDQDKKLVYRGQLDDSRPGNAIPVTGKDIREALDSLLSNKPVSVDQKASIGCNIKWKA